MARLFSRLAAVFFLLVVTCGTSHAKERLVSVILVKDQPRYAGVHKEFLAHLEQKSHQEYRVYVQTPNADFMSLRNSVRKAVAIGSDLIIVYGASAALAAQAESGDVPVLFADVYNPVKQGLVTAEGAALRMTLGVRGDGPVQTLVKVLQDTTHGKRFGVLYNPDDPTGVEQAKAVAVMAAKRDLQIVEIKVRNTTQVKDVISPSANLDGLIVTDSLNFSARLTEIVTLAANKKLPSAAQIPGFADIGGFIALENDPVEQGEQLALLASRVLAGEDFNRLRMVKPRNVALIINLKTANALNISVPFDVLSMTSRVVR